MKTNTAGLPLIFRREAFGGLLFDPADGTLLELDHEAAATVSAALADERFKPAGEGRALLARVKKETAWSRRRPAYQVQAAPVPAPAAVSVLSAPTLLDMQITSCCYLNCSHCYANATPEGTHVPLQDIELVINEARKCGVCQLALGGGEPLLHPGLAEILELTQRNGIVPNLSTSGLYLTKPNLKLLKKYCGAVAISLENTGDKFTLWRKTSFAKIREALQLLKHAGIPAVVQITLSAANFADLPALTDFCLSEAPLYGVIFLAYKPVGRGEKFSSALAGLDAHEVSTGLQSAFHKLVKKMRVGYDCCLTPALAGFIHPDYLEGCSALRGSAGISPELDVLPCTFLPGRRIGNLKQTPLAEIWRSSQALAFRESIANHLTAKEQCQACEFKSACLAGCPALDLVNCYRPGD